MTNAFDHFSRLFEPMAAQDIQTVVDLARAQLVVEGLTNHPTFGPCVARPEDAADTPVLCQLIAAAACRGVTPKSGTDEESIRFIAAGGYLRWPPPPDADVSN